MALAQTDNPTPRKPLRLWPGVVIAILLSLLRFVVPVVAPDAVLFGIPAMVVAIIGGVLAGLAVVLWWLFFSRAPWSERLGAIALMVVALVATPRILHESIATGAMGMLFFISSIPVLSLALVVWAAASRGLRDGPRRASMAATILLACGSFTLLRTGGITGDGASDLHWRWSATPEERLLARTDEAPLGSARGGPAVLPSTPATPETPRKPPAEAPRDSARGKLVVPPAAPSTARISEKPLVDEGGDESFDGTRGGTTAVMKGRDWPGFRGPIRDGVVRGVRIETDWSRLPPVQLWRRPVGPGWSSFAVRGDVFYTQEQRGENEVVAAYRVATGEPVWQHRDGVRFWESNGGAGPRATPTLSNGRVYTFGATGILNVLNARDGSLVWSHNAGSDTGMEIPGWGFASSPLVVNDVVIVAAAGTLVAYDLATGNRRWSGPKHGGSYSSPHLSTLDGVSQILLQNGAGVTSVAPADGTLLWEHAWPGFRIVQPALTADGDVLISDADSAGGIAVRRIAVAHGTGGWTVEERWTSPGLKPYFNDLVVHKGHAFGFDGGILSCIDLGDGKRKWKGGRYGHGQLVLLPDQDLLLVLSEDGELALVRATADQFAELVRFPALEGKTWNHPVLVGDVLLVRNGQEMAAFRLSLADR